MAQTGRYAAVIALGAVIRGETPHFDHICRAAASGLSAVGLETGVPVTFGVLTTESRAQAEARAGGAVGNAGADAADGRGDGQPRPRGGLTAPTVSLS